MKVLFAAGGTGGHIYPAIAVADELKETAKDVEIVFVSGKKEIEKSIMEKTDYKTLHLPVSGMPRKLSFEMAGFAYRFLVSMGNSFRIINKVKPSVVVATGGYVSAPVILNAAIKNIPVAIQEQNSFPGVTNRKLGRFADTVFLGFGEAKKFFENTGAEIMVTGNPVRKSLIRKNKNDAASLFGISPDKKTLLVFGGSQGSHTINTEISKVLGEITDAGIQIIWQTGSTQYEKWCDACLDYDGNVKVLPYIDDMASAYSVADMVVARAGAIALAEIASYGLPALLIPLPTAAANHQEKNARVFEKNGAGMVITEKELTGSKIAEAIISVLADPEKKESMSKAATGLGGGDAAKIIAEKLFEKYGNR